jgi:DNA repair protein RadC
MKPKNPLNYSIQNMPLEERPRERLLQSGVESLSTAELIAIILGSGTKGKSVLQMSQELLSHFGSLKNLSEATVKELCQIKGLGEAKALQLKAAFGLGSKISRQAIPLKVRIENPLHVYHLLKEELENEKREFFIVILQDVKANLICHEVVAIGTLSNTLVHPREVFYPAIRHKAASLILAHNHPSGDPTPSKQDLEVTKILIEAGKLVGIPVQDHLIIGHGSYISLRQISTLFL